VTSRNTSPDVTTARCPACGEQMPDRDHSRGGRKARYCSGACKARADRTRQQAGSPAVSDKPPLPETVRTLHRLIAELATFASSATVTKRVTLRRAPAGTPQATLLFGETPLAGNGASPAIRGGK
jgi:hypothetical protein